MQGVIHFLQRTLSDANGVEYCLELIQNKIEGIITNREKMGKSIMVNRGRVLICCDCGEGLNNCECHKSSPMWITIKKEAFSQPTP